jgi:uncharacterized membrane protein
MKHHNFCMVIGQHGNGRVVAVTSDGSPHIYYHNRTVR